MGSKHPFPQNSLETAIEPTVPIISVLVNAIRYFLQHVLIIKADENYRLLVIHWNHVLLDKNYNTLKGAKIAFEKLFKNRDSHIFKKNEWSHQYDPDNDWFMELLNLANMDN